MYGDRLERVVLFGSRARGDAERYSTSIRARGSIRDQTPDLKARRATATARSISAARLMARRR